MCKFSDMCKFSIMSVTDVRCVMLISSLRVLTHETEDAGVDATQASEF